MFGFLALCFMQFTLGKDIGLVMAKGVFLGLITVVTVLPAFVLQLDKLIHKTGHKSLVPSFSKLNGFLLKHKKVVAVIFLLAFVPAVICQGKMAVYQRNKCVSDRALHCLRFCCMLRLFLLKAVNEKYREVHGQG